MIPHPRRLIPHLASCFAGGAVDSVFRVAAVAALTAAAAGSGAGGEGAATRYATWAMLCFTVPFLVFAPLAGSLGDRLPKHLLMRWIRFVDLPVLALGAIGLWTGQTGLLLGALALLGTASAFFAPVKLSCIPELVPDAALPAANAWIQGITILAIVLGMALASLADPQVVSLGMHPALVIAIVGGGIAAIGLVGAWLVPTLPAQNPAAPFRPFAYLSQAKVLFERPGLAIPAFSLAGFWGLGAAVSLLFSPIGKFAWGLDAAGPALFGLCLSVGIVIGAGAAPRLMAVSLPAGLPIVGALIAGISLIIAGWVGSSVLEHPQLWTDMKGAPPGSLLVFASMMVLAGIGSGLWDVPMNVLLQQRADPASRNRVMAAMGIATAVGMVIASLLAYQLSDWLGLTSAQIMFLLGGIAAALALGGVWLYRRDVVGWGGTLVVKMLFKVDVQGAQHMPRQGGCVLAANHLSLADGIILSAYLPRRAKFMVYAWFCDLPLIGWGLRTWGVIPVDGKGGARALIAAVQTAMDEAAAGNVVGLFPEGKMTRSGMLDTFKPGIERIAQRAGVPIIPCAIDGLWRTPYSYAVRKHWWPLVRIPVRVRLGPAMPSDTSAGDVRQAVSALFTELASQRASTDRRTLGIAALRSCRRHPWHPAVIESSGTLERWKLAAMALALRPRLGLATDETSVGVLLPPGRGGAIANLAIALSGRSAVNLNHTVGITQVRRMCELAGVRTILTARAYLKRIALEDLPGRTLYIEQILPEVGALEVMVRAVSLYAVPVRWRCRAQPQAVAAVVFSSGSTGDPKGVQLTHQQVLANCDSVRAALDVGIGDVVLTPLPLFHSMGLVPGFWLALESGLAIAAHPDPTDAKGLGELAQRSKATFTITTATFARGWMRRVGVEQFSSLRFAVAGAERCPADLRRAFKDKYGSDLLEGYGCTELAPVVSVNMQTISRLGETEVRTRDGTVGRPLPGIHVLAIDPVTRVPLPIGQDGLLVVRSPGRMLGYLSRPDLDAKVFVHDGYDTGDIGHIDSDGYVTITGRLARFAKIAGEMVPLDTVEDALQSAVGEGCELAVSAISDPERGERLLVLVVASTPMTPDEILIGAATLAPIWRPKARDVHVVSNIPKLGTGKRDLASIKRLASELGAK